MSWRGKLHSKTKYIVGTQPLLEWAIAAWREVAPDTELIAIELTQNQSYQFDLRHLGSLPRENCTAFVAQDDQFLNFRRYELMAELKSRGFSMPPLIEKGAIVAASAKISENTWISAGAIIGQDCKVGFNTVIGPGANIGNSAKIGNSVWIEAGTLIGPSAIIGTNTTLKQGVIVGSRVEIGKQVIIDKPGKIFSNIDAKTFIHASFEEPIFIVDSQQATE